MKKTKHTEQQLAFALKQANTCRHFLRLTSRIPGPESGMTSRPTSERR